MLYKGFISFKRHISDHLLIYSTVLLFFLIGISVGAFTVKIVDNHQKEDLIYYLKDFFHLFYYNDLSHGTILRQSFVNNFQLLSINWILGAFIITAPLVLLIIGFKGFIIGFTTSLLIEEFKLWGILLFLFGIFPQNTIIITVFIITNVLSLTFAASFIKEKISKSKSSSFSRKYILYSVLFLVLLLFIALACIIESYIAPFFIRFIVKNII